LLDVGAALGGTDEDDIEARGALSEGRVLTKKNFRGHRDAGLLPGCDGPSGLILGLPLLNLDKGEVIPPPRNEINLARFRFVPLCQDAVALAFKELPRATFRSDAYGVRALWRGASAGKLHDDWPFNFNAKL
jgi:hypothetical protein